MNKKTLLAFALTAAATSTAVAAHAASFGATDINGYMVAENTAEKAAEGKCGEGKCGEGTCGAADTSGTHATDAKAGEGKCGEGKCGEGTCGGKK